MYKRLLMFLFQHVKDPTRYRDQNTPSILDLILTNEENMISQMNYKPGLGKSDHLILEFNYNCYIKQSLSNNKKFDYFKGNYKTINQTQNNINWAEICRDLA